MPAHVTVITEKEIRDSGATSLVEILERQGGFNSARTAVMSPFHHRPARGWAAAVPFGKVQIQLNGRRLNRPDMASVNWFHIAARWKGSKSSGARAASSTVIPLWPASSTS